MQNFFFINDTYHEEIAPQILNVTQTTEMFGFNYIESNLTQRVYECMLHETKGDIIRFNKFMAEYHILKEPEKHLAIHQTCANNATGYGIVALSNIPANTIVMEYDGERVSKKTQTSRDFSESLEINYGMGVGDTVVDSGRYGNLARFFFHLPSEQHPLERRSIKLGNLKQRPISCPDGDHAFLFSNKQINVGEEMGFDYGKSYYFEHTYRVDPSNGECFQARKESSIDLLESYSDIISECEDELSVQPENYNLQTNLTNALIEKGKLEIFLERYAEAVEDFQSILRVNPFSFSDKIKVANLIGNTRGNAMCDYMDNKCGKNRTDTFHELWVDLLKEMKFIFMYEDEKKLEKIAELFGQYSDDECVKHMYNYFVKMTEEWVSNYHLSQDKGFCTEGDKDVWLVSSSFYSSGNADLSKLLCNYASVQCEQDFETGKCGYTTLGECRAFLRLEQEIDFD